MSHPQTTEHGMNILHLLSLRDRAAQVITTTLAEMAQIHVKPFETPRNACWAEQYQAATLTLESRNEDIKGKLTMVVQEEMAKHIAENMLGMDPEEVDNATMLDVVGEILNMVAGNIKTDLANNGMESHLTTPQMLNPQEIPEIEKSVQVENPDGLSEEVVLGDSGSKMWFFLLLNNVDECKNEPPLPLKSF